MRTLSRRTTCRSQFYLSFRRSNLISCERVALGQLANCNFTSVFGARTSFRANGLPLTLQNRNFTSVFGNQTSFRGNATDASKSQFYSRFWRSNLISCERVAADTSKSQFSPCLWRLNLVSCETVAFRAVSLALPRALREK